MDIAPYHSLSLTPLSKSTLSTSPAELKASASVCKNGKDTTIYCGGVAFSRRGRRRHDKEIQSTLTGEAVTVARISGIVQYHLSFIIIWYVNNALL